MIAAFQKYLDSFIHPKVDRTGEDYAIARVLVIVLQSFFVVLVFYNLFFIVNGIFWSAKAIFNYVGLGLIVACLVIVKTTNRYKWALRVLCIVGIFLISTSAYLSGGIYSNDLTWYVVAAISALMFIGVLEGRVTLIVSILLITGFYLLEVFDVKDFAEETLATSLSYKYVNTLFVTCITFMVVYILVQGNKRLQRVMQSINERNVRQGIARDFHDQIGNSLAAIKHLASLCREQSNDEKDNTLKKIESRAAEVYDSFKDLIWTQRSENNYLDELFTYLKDYLESFFESSNSVLTIAARPEEIPRVNMSAVVSRELIALVKELSTNVLKHANADKVNFGIHYQDSKLTIKFRDDGKGFDLERGSFPGGVSNIRYRAEKLEGEYLYISSPNDGTSFVITITT